MTGRASSVFFDIGGTLADATVTGTGPDRLIHLTVRDGVLTALSELSQEGLSLGVISNTPSFVTRQAMDDALQGAGLLTFFSPDLLIYSSIIGIDKSSVLIFCYAADLAGHPHNRDQCVFVGEDGEERRIAEEAGFRVAATVGAARSVALGVG